MGIPILDYKIDFILYFFVFKTNTNIVNTNISVLYRISGVKKD
jgi:hypothetical protein